MSEEGNAAEGPATGDLGVKFERLAGVMARLRSEDGCPWDLEQTPATLSRHMLEESYEAVEAIDSEDWEHLSEELGDLLLQILFQSRIAEEEGRFELGDVVDGITEKLLRRHPHIFGGQAVSTAEQVSVNWERIKTEQEGKEPSDSHLGLPATMGALKLQHRAARGGFDWPAPEGVFEKLAEEAAELEGAVGGPREDLEHEVGDLLFTVINLARHLDVDPETALRRTNREFARRYAEIEVEARGRGVEPRDMPPEEKERIWSRAKEGPA
ncbi:MAG: nucleoside triphosphate pyrophosphohydrolase [Actinomycetota bacterium]